MNKRIYTIRKIQGCIEYIPNYADEILWTKEQGYADNYWFRFRFGDNDYALYLQGEEFCANVDFRLFICCAIDDTEVPIGKKRLIHTFGHHDVSLAMAWAEEWLLNNLNSISTVDLTH